MISHRDTEDTETLRGNEGKLPEGWQIFPLRKLASISGGKTPSTAKEEYWAHGTIPWVSPKDMKSELIEDTIDHLNASVFSEAGMPKISKGSVLVVVRSGILQHSLPVAIATRAMTINQDIKALKPSAQLTPRFLYLFLKSEEGNILRTATKAGTTVQSIETDKLLDYPIPLPPIPEQERIAARLDLLLGKLKAARKRLDGMPELIKRFRKSVLAEAVSGRLTEEWREEKSISSLWELTTLEEIADIVGGITKDSNKQSNADEEIPYLRVANVKRGYLDLSEVKTIRIPIKRVQALLLKEGDVLFNEGGDLDKVGRGWIWQGEIERCSFQNHIFRARLYNQTNSPKFISWWGNSRGQEYFFRGGKQTTGIASISRSMLSKLPIELPSTEEQSEIVRRVDELFAYADALESRVAEARKLADRLEPAILAKAFRGELTEQIPEEAIEWEKKLAELEAEAGKLALGPGKNA